MRLPGRDSIPWGLILMGLFSVAAGVYAGYEYRQVHRYQDARQKVINRFPKLQRLSLQIQKYEKEGGKRRPHIRTALLQIAENLGLRPEPIVPRDNPVGEYREHSFEVRVKHVQRGQVLRYIHSVRQRIPGLRAKEIEMAGTEQSAPPQDRWHWRIVFAHREKMKR